MLNEPSGINDSPVTPAVPIPGDPMRDRLRAAVEEVFFIESENSDSPAPITVSYTGRLTMDSAAAYDKLDALFTPLDHLPIFTMDGQRQVIRAARGRFNVKPRPVWPNILL